MTLKLGQGQQLYQSHIIFLLIVDAKFHSESPSWLRDTARTLAEKREENLNDGLVLLGV